jgi:hypothetical protein
MPSDMKLKIQKMKLGGKDGDISKLDTSILRISE